MLSQSPRSECFDLIPLVRYPPPWRLLLDKYLLNRLLLNGKLTWKTCLDKSALPPTSEDGPLIKKTTEAWLCGWQKDSELR